MEQHRSKIWFFRLSAVGISVLVALFLVEGLLWVPDLFRPAAPQTGPSSQGEISEFCATRHHSLVPNRRRQHSGYEFAYIWSNNSLGMRDREHSLHKEPGTFRILVLGDSFIQGHGVRLEDTMVTHLEASLNRPKRTKPVEILNGGVYGYSPMLEYAYLREIIDAMQPDLVIVGLFLGNDVGEDYFYTQKAHLSSDGQSFSFDDNRWPWSLIEAALDHGSQPRSGDASLPPHQSPAFQSETWWPHLKDMLAHSRALTLLKRRIVDVLTYPTRREREFALVREHREDIRYDLGLVNYPVLSKSDRLAYWDISERYLQKIATLCRQHRAALILVVIPPVERLKGETDFNEPYEVLDDVGRQLSIPVIQLLPDLLGKDPDSLYYKYDRHWTPEGHNFAAQILDRELRRLNALPADG